MAPTARNRSHGQLRDRQVTLADVAALAGVSPSTASRALNGRGYLSEETRAAVIDAARRLEFEPSPVARSLRTSSTQTVGFIVPDVSSPFYAHALKGASGALESNGYRVVLMDADQSDEREATALQTLLSHRVDGLLLATVGISVKLFENVLRRRPVPCVYFDSRLDRSGAGSVLVDNTRGVDLLVDHLVQHGHRRIGLVAGSRTETSGRERVEAFRSAMRRHGLPIGRAHVGGTRWSTAESRDVVLRMLVSPRPPTAIVASSVELALGVMEACRECEMRIPEDIALASFDNASFAGLLDPPLTSADYDPADVGRQAALLLVDAMRGADYKPRDVRLTVSLVVRRSCGCGAYERGSGGFHSVSRVPSRVFSGRSEGGQPLA